MENNKIQEEKFMDINVQELKLLLEMIEEDIKDKIDWLKSKHEPQYKLYNAGQIKAFKHVLDLMVINNSKVM
jgi:hypothetical protein